MRLGQLARKVAVHPNEIVEFLAKNGVVIDEGTNTRITDSDTEIVLRQYAPHLLIQVTPPDKVREEMQVTESDTPEIISGDLEPEVTILATTEDPLDKEYNQSAVESVEAPELIKAAKVELKGLKVIGKIDLPDLKKKENIDEVLATEPSLPSSAPAERKRNQKRDYSKQQSKRSNKNPVALERERLEREAEERKLRKAEEERERRKNYYAKRVKPSGPTKALKIIEEDVSTLEEEPKEPPKGLLGKFLHWLTS